MIVAVVSDLIFESKISATAGVVGAAVRVVRSLAAAEALEPGAAALIIDMNLPAGDPLAYVRGLRERRPRLPVVAFVSHVQTELIRATRAAGVTNVLAKSAFTTQLADLLRELSRAPESQIPDSPA